MLLEAATAGNVERVRDLIAAGTPLEQRDAAKRTALLLATRANQVEVARLLIEAGADVNAKDNIRDTPFLYAGAEGRNEILKLILASGRANLRDTNRYGGVALIPAAHHAPSRNGAHPARHRHRHRPRQQSRLDGADRGGDPGRRRPGVPGDRRLAGRCRRAATSPTATARRRSRMRVSAATRKSPHGSKAARAADARPAAANPVFAAIQPFNLHNRGHNGCQSSWSIENAP